MTMSPQLTKPRIEEILPTNTTKPTVTRLEAGMIAAPLLIGVPFSLLFDIGTVGVLLSILGSIAGAVLVATVPQHQTLDEWLGAIRYARTNAGIVDTIDATVAQSSDTTRVFEAEKTTTESTRITRFYPELGIGELSDGRMVTTLTLTRAGHSENWQQLRTNLGKVFLESNKESDSSSQSSPIEFEFQLYFANSGLPASVRDEVISEVRADDPVLKAQRDATESGRSAVLQSSGIDATSMYLLLDVSPSELPDTSQLSSSETRRRLITLLRERRERLKEACERVLDQYTSQLSSSTDWVVLREKAWRWKLVTTSADNWERTISGSLTQTLVGNESVDTLDDTVLETLVGGEQYECDFSVYYQPIEDKAPKTEQSYNTSVSVSIYGDDEQELRERTLTVKKVFRDYTDLDLETGVTLV